MLESISASSVGGKNFFYWNVVEMVYAISVNDIHVFSFSNVTGDDVLTFRSSTDGGSTFANKLDLMNSTNSNSKKYEVSTDDDNIVIGWWDRNASSNKSGYDESENNGVRLGIILLRYNETINTIE
jgi:peroxiredoxin